MTNKYRRARKKRKKRWPYLLSFFLLVVLGSGIGTYLAKPSLFSGLQFWKAKRKKNQIYQLFRQKTGS